ncbi:MAG: hypothetical protein HOV94_23430 [Saccharothrix sp.]|nr:hypothetical protein [Saccharothrix sp.]
MKSGVRSSGTTSHRYIGGYAVEYAKSADKNGTTTDAEKEKARAGIKTDLDNLLERRYGKTTDYLYDFMETVVDSIEVTKKHGSVLAALCWITFQYAPVPNELLEAMEALPHDD